MSPAAIPADAQQAARRVSIGFINFAHALDHYVMLIFPMVVIALQVPYARSYAELIALGTASFVAFGVFSLPAGWLGGREGANIEFRAEFFNIFNHQNLADPINTFRKSGFGQVRAIVGTPRDIQFAMKLNF